MEKLQIKFLKTESTAKLPTCNNITPGTGDSGYDIYACEDCIVPPKDSEVVPTGITVAYLTPGYWFKIEGRSGLGFKHSIAPHNGIVDNSYRGDLGIKLYNHGSQPYYVKAGDRIAQLVIYPLIQAEVSWADTIQETDRGDKGFGSSGK
jgi:dUTP pyrophosphatase